MPPIRLPQHTWNFIFDLCAASAFGAVMAAAIYLSGMNRFVGGIITGGFAVHQFFRLRRNDAP